MRRENKSYCDKQKNQAAWMDSKLIINQYAYSDQCDISDFKKTTIQRITFYIINTRQPFCFDFRL